MRGQILLVRQIAAQSTKVNPWENYMTEVDIFSFVTPNFRGLVSTIALIYILQQGPLDETVFLLTMELAPHTHTTWLNLKYHVT